MDSVRRYYPFTDWPNGLAQVDLGDRTVDVIPTPGHNETEVTFYDRSTGLLFTGDFLMPARLLIDDTNGDLASAERVAAFAKDRPISFALGGHIVLNSAGELFPWESQYHPHEHVLQLTKDDVLALPAAIRSFNGFYSVHGKFTMENSMRILMAFAVLVIVAELPSCGHWFAISGVVDALANCARKSKADRTCQQTAGPHIGFCLSVLMTGNPEVKGSSAGLVHRETR